MPATVTILGCGSAKPTPTNYPSSQLLCLRDRRFMIDCGEGTQIRMMTMPVRHARMNHIFISHLHGDHCFGLIGLISTLGMIGHMGDIHIHAQPDLKRLLQPLIDYHCEGMGFQVVFDDYNPHRSELIYEDRVVKVTTLPLKHRVPCCGFLFEEKEGMRHIFREAIDRYHIPIACIPLIKQGADFQLTDGTVIPNDQLTTPPTPPTRYAYCSDTAYNERLIPLIEGVDLLYHEATFSSAFEARARETMHSTGAQAATIALKAGVKQLLIGHFSARHGNQEDILGEARAIFPNTILAQDTHTYSF